MPVAISDFLVPLMCYRPRTLCHSAGKETAGCQDKDFSGPQSLGSQIAIRKNYISAYFNCQSVGGYAQSCITWKHTRKILALFKSVSFTKVGRTREIMMRLRLICCV